MKAPAHDTMVSNILSEYAQASAEHRAGGMAWYESAHRQADNWAAYYNLTIEQAAGVIAALSPITPWQRNLVLAQEAIQQSKRPVAWRGRLATLQANADKAMRILSGEDPWSVLTSQKVRAFFEGILYAGNTDLVCVDRHAMSIAAGMYVVKADQGMTPRQYGQYAAAYQEAAERIGIPASKLQAITWVSYRARKGIVD